MPLAFERTLLAYERTQIAWVRTALALISFGFAIAKLFQYLRQQTGETAGLMSPRMVGLVMIVIGLVGLILANLQQRRAVLAFSSSTLIVRMDLAMALRRSLSSSQGQIFRMA